MWGQPPSAVRHWEPPGYRAQMAFLLIAFRSTVEDNRIVFRYPSGKRRESR